VPLSYEVRGGVCRRCSKECHPNFHTGIMEASYRYPLQQRWRKFGRTWYLFLREMTGKQRSHALRRLHGPDYVESL
jgi:hypothetical protein